MVRGSTRTAGGVIRANLLPREAESLTILGVGIAVQDVRRIIALTILAAILLAGVGGVQIWRERQLLAAATDAEAQLDLQSQLRRRVAALARDVALLQRIERESAVARNSGNRAALAIARIGNAIPPRVWLSTLDRHPDGYFISGSGDSYGGIATALRALDHVVSPKRARLGGASRSATGVLFTIRLATERAR